MKFRGINYDGHSILEMVINQDYELLEKAEFCARKKCHRVVQDDPSGRVRTQAEIYSQNFLGALADVVCAEVLKKYFNQMSINADVVRYDEIRADNFEDHDQFDIKVVSDKTEHIVEVRSSVCCFLSLDDMINRWQVLGSYTSASKGGTETTKDFYLRPLYHYDSHSIGADEYSREDGHKHVLNGNLALYLVGGVSGCELLSRGREECGKEMKQDGSNYKVLNIKDAPDAKLILEIIANTINANN